MHMIFEGDLSVKLHAKDVEVGTSSDRKSRQDQVTMGRAHSRKVLVLLGFTSMHHS